MNEATDWWKITIWFLQTPDSNKIKLKKAVFTRFNGRSLETWVVVKQDRFYNEVYLVSFLTRFRNQKCKIFLEQTLIRSQFSA